MGRNLRVSGIDLIGDVPWGTHLCSFYQTKRDLLNMVMPYFKAGLESNEFCFWVVSDPFDDQERKIVSSTIPDFDYYLTNGQIELVPYNRWYHRNGELYLKNLISDWTQITEKAISRGFDGLRGAGYCAWVEQKDWESFMEYEAAVNDMIGQLPIMLLCYFDLLRSNASDVVDVVNSHRFALVNREGGWEMIETFQHKMTEQALRDSEEKFRVLTETAACGICILQGHKVTYANSEAEKLIGYSRDDLLKMKISEFVHPDYQQFFQINLTGDSICPLEQEIKILTGDGREKWVIFSCGTAVIQEQQVVLGTFFDITDRKIAEEITQKELYRVQRMEAVGKLASGMAHEINNQLTVIQAYLDLYAKDDSFSFIRSKIGQAVEKTSRLNRQLMLYSRHREPSKELFDLNNKLKDLDKMFTQMIGEDVTIHYQLAKDLWMINADAANIEQVIVNLILNARDAMPHGGIIAVTTKNVVIDKGGHSSKAVCLTISDTGTGIDDNSISQIFEPFFTTKGLGKGTGLGLTVVNNIVKAHAGWIDVQSTTGEGTTFNIYLPATDNISHLSRVSSADHRIYRGKGEKILLVEDDPDVMNLTGMVLGENGYTVSMCRNACEALDLFEKKDFDLLISDLVLPDGRGVSLATRLRERKPDLKVLLVSGYSDSLMGMEKALKQEYPFLPKPYTAFNLLRKVHGLFYGQTIQNAHLSGIESFVNYPVV